MKKNRNSKPESFIKQPNYPGGKNAFEEFIRAELKYPEEAMANNIEGTVAMEHDIDINGNVIEVRIKHKLGYGCDEEAVRVVKLLKYEKKRYRGLRVVFHRPINIHFRMNKVPQITMNETPSEQVITYNYQENSDKSSVINYNIRFD